MKLSRRAPCLAMATAFSVAASCGSPQDDPRRAPDALGPAPDAPHVASPEMDARPRASTSSHDAADPPPAIESADAVPATDIGAPVRAQPAAVRRRTVMCLGDSATAGYVGLGTFRYFLWKQLSAAGYDFDFVGTQTKNAYRHDDVPGDVVTWPDREHEGHEGLTAAEAVGKIGPWANASKPDVTLILLGNNDAGAGKGPQIASNLGKIIGALRRTNDKAAVLVAQLFPGTNGRDAIPSINREIAMLGPKMHTERNPVIVVDLYHLDYQAKDFCCSGWHLRDSGHEKMTTRWYPALAPLLSKKTAEDAR